MDAFHARQAFMESVVQWIQADGITNVLQYFLTAITAAKNISKESTSDNDVLEFTRLNDIEMAMAKNCSELLKFDDVSQEFTDKRD